MACKKKKIYVCLIILSITLLSTLSLEFASDYNDFMVLGLENIKENA